MFKSTKIIDLGSCAFRQPEADSHCRFIHGYRLKAKFWFEANQLDKNNWVVDFGGLKNLKKHLEIQFDHTTCISRDDPKLDMFKKLRDAGVCDLRVMDGVGIEKFAEWCHMTANKHVTELTSGRCRCVKVEVFEHENNSAIYEVQTSSQLGAAYLDTKCSEIQSGFQTTEEIAEDIATAVDTKQADVTRPPFKNSRPAPVGQKPERNTWTSDSTALGL